MKTITLLPVLLAVALAACASADVSVENRVNRAVERAATLDARGPMRTNAGARRIPLGLLFDDLLAFRDALDAAKGHPELAQKAAQIHHGLTRTRRQLLQEWSSEVRVGIPMTDDEQQRFFSIVARYAATVGRTTSYNPQPELRALLGPERWASYEKRRAAFFPKTVPYGLVFP